MQMIELQSPKVLYTRIKTRTNILVIKLYIYHLLAGLHEGINSLGIRKIQHKILNQQNGYQSQLQNFY